MINGLVHRPTGEAADVDGRTTPNWGAGSGERIDALGLDGASLIERAGA